MTSSPSPWASIRRSIAAARSPAASRAPAATSSSTSMRREHRRRGHDAALERALAPLAEHLLDPPGAARGALGRVPHPGDLVRPVGVARRGVRAAMRLDRLVERRADAPQARADGVVAVVRLRRLLGERAESSALALELGGQLAPSDDEGLGADAQALVRGADGGEPSPLRRPLTIAVSQALLDLGAPLGDLGQLGLDLLARLARLGGARTQRRRARRREREAR